MIFIVCRTFNENGKFKPFSWTPTILKSSQPTPLCPYIQKANKSAETAFWPKINWRKKCINRDKDLTTKVRKAQQKNIRDKSAVQS